MAELTTQIDQSSPRYPIDLKIDEETRQIARTYAPDLYLTALLAPASRKPPLIAMAAFLGDLQKIVLTVSDPTLAEIRLQWWRDALSSGLTDGTMSGRPTADAVIAVARAHQLPFDGFDRALDARVLDLYADPLPNEAALDAYCDATFGHAFGVALAVLGTPSTSSSTPFVSDAARCYGRARLLCQTAALVARGRAPLLGSVPSQRQQFEALVSDNSPDIRSRYDTIKSRWRNASAAERLCCLPVVLVPAYLKALDAVGPNLASQIVDISNLSRTWRLWRSQRLGWL